MAFKRKTKTIFPVQGTPGGWRDVWDDPDDRAQLRACAEAADHRLTLRAQELGRLWRLEDPRVDAKSTHSLAVVAAGLRNAEIAERLYLTPKTVSHHLSAIYAKLGVET